MMRFPNDNHTFAVNRSKKHSAMSAAMALFAIGLVSACAQDSSPPIEAQTQTANSVEAATPSKAQASTSDTEPVEVPSKTAVFAGGCFWCTESDFEKLPGVVEAVSGYTGGTVDNPTYREVSYTETGHFEAVQVTYNPSIVDYRTLVDYHFRHIDPLDAGGQFCDRGSSYRTAIFVQSPEEREIAQASADQASQDLGKPVVTPIIDASTFWVAEEYHQDYYLKNPLRYKVYRTRCGRDARIAELWGKPDTDTLDTSAVTTHQ